MEMFWFPFVYKTPGMLPQNEPSNMSHQNTLPSWKNSRCVCVCVQDCELSGTKTSRYCFGSVWTAWVIHWCIYLSLRQSAGQPEAGQGSREGGDIFLTVRREADCLFANHLYSFSYLFFVCVCVCLLFHFHIPMFLLKPKHSPVMSLLDRPLSLLKATLTLDPFTRWPSVWGVEADFATELCKWEREGSWLVLTLYS